MTIQIFHTFVQLLAESVPLFLLGATAGALLEVWLKPEWVERWINRPHHSVFAATIIGAVLPGCAVSTIPLAQSLQRRGAPVGTLTAFIMIAPILSPHTIVLTATLLSFPMAIGRVVLAFVVSLVLGEILNALPLQQRTNSFLQKNPEGDPSRSADPVCCESDQNSSSVCDVNLVSGLRIRTPLSEQKRPPRFL